MSAPARTPVSTYRLQFGGEMGFRRASEIIPYLSKLGITEIYASPLLAARPGGTHGYDLCDPSRLNPELGTTQDFEAFRNALRAHGLGLILDFVPNHMGNDPAANPWWRDLLENGPSSPYSRYFDVDWDPVKPELKNRILLPVLGDQYGAVLESGQLRVRYQQGRFSLHYWQLDLPMNLRRMRPVLRYGLEEFSAAQGEDDADVRELRSILFHLDHIPPYTETDPDRSAERHREMEVVRERLASLTDASQAVREHIERAVERFNTPDGENSDYLLLHRLLEEQVYRLSYWRTAMHEINYRRFFDINELAAIRMEDPAVFDDAHEMVARLAREGTVTGLRLDHVDGLYDPAAYFERLCESVRPEPNARLYVVAEKVLSLEEQLPSQWAVDGTTGYDFLNDVTAVFIDGRSAPRLRRMYARFAGEMPAFADVVYESKKLIIATSMASELNVLAHELNRISEADWRCRDFTLDSLQEALREVAACFPVYRTYVNQDGWTPYDQKAIETAIARALRRNPAMEPSIFDFLSRMFLPVRKQWPSEASYRRAMSFAMKFQQYTGPVQAKGVEDTAFYRYGPLLSQNEVGGEPWRFGSTVAEFHESNQRRAQNWPLTMLASTTHDTKRGEDARARLNVLSEVPDEFRLWLSQAARSTAGLKTILDGMAMPDRADEYLYYQTLLASWPMGSPEDPGDEFVERMREYMRKATKEKKVHTSWIHASDAYDVAVSDFVTRSLTGRRWARFRKHLAAFHRRISLYGMLNSLSQLALKLCAPGVPDIYQGAETWNLSLVDPDNRRPVDFERLAETLEALDHPARDRSGWLRDLLASGVDGRVKMLATAEGLRLRSRWPDVFTHGTYEPMEVAGSQREHVVAFTRRASTHRSGDRTVMVVAGRFFASLARHADSLPLADGIWEDTTIATPAGAGALVDILSGRRHEPIAETLTANDVLADFPAAILTNG
ncbi:MAG: malto-oligosyltrehalose synthase [Bryobacteraceae bacterium]